MRFGEISRQLEGNILYSQCNFWNLENIKLIYQWLDWIKNLFHELLFLFHFDITISVIVWVCDLYLDV